jgi:predicted nucleic-acid-binding protein
MIAFDTNLLVRLVVNHDHDQAETAERLLETQQVFISRTILLETEWVLRSVYQKTQTEISDFFTKALITTNLVIENSSESALTCSTFDIKKKLLIARKPVKTYGQGTIAVFVALDSLD